MSHEPEIVWRDRFVDFLNVHLPDHVRFGIVFWLSCLVLWLCCLVVVLCCVVCVVVVLSCVVVVLSCVVVLCCVVLSRGVLSRLSHV